MAAFELGKNPVHLGLGATIHNLPEFTGDMSWYADYGAKHGGDGDEGRLVTIHSFTENWDSWEVHPRGAELVVCIAGSMTLIQEIDGEHVRTDVVSGQAVVNEPGVWHTAEIAESATALFITAGAGTEHRPL